MRVNANDLLIWAHRLYICIYFYYLTLFVALFLFFSSYYVYCRRCFIWDEFMVKDWAAYGECDFSCISFKICGCRYVPDSILLFIYAKAMESVLYRDFAQSVSDSLNALLFFKGHWLVTMRAIIYYS